MKKSYYIVTKPLQYINATNILDGNEKICLFINTMNNGDELYKLIKEKSSFWNEVIFFERRLDALDWLIKKNSDFDNFYIDSDFGYLIQKRLGKIRANIFVYEEGNGTYRNSLRPKTIINNVITAINRILGNKDFFGGYKWTKGIYVYDIPMHKQMVPKYKKQRLSFNKSFIDHLSTFQDSEIFLPKLIKSGFEKLRSRKILVYLTSWSINSEIFSILDNFTEYFKLLKPHPNISSEISVPQFDKVIEGFIPIEMVLVFFAEICEEIVVIHEGSSSLMYLGAKSNIRIIDVNEFKLLKAI